MTQYTHKMVNGERIDLTPEEIAELQARDAAYVPPTAPAEPTKEELLAKLQELSEKINSL
jgi:hypothetical protein